MRRLIIGIFSAVVLFVLFIVLCTFIRRPYETVLLDRFGSLIGEKQQAHIAYNWYFKLPTDSVVRIDHRLHLYTGPLQQVVTSKSEPISVRTFAAWRIVDPIKFYQKTSGSDQRARDIMDERLRGLVGQQFSNHQLDEFFNTDPKTEAHTAEIETELAREASDGSKDGKIPGLKELGLEIAEVGFSRMAFPPSNTDAIYQRMVAELNEKARGYESKGLAEAEAIRAEGNRKAAETRAQAIAESEAVKGAGDRQALEIISKVNQTDAAREFYQYWKSLDFLKSSLAKNTYMVLSSDSPLLKALFLAPLNSNFTAPTPTTKPAFEPGATSSAAPVVIPVPGLTTQRK